MNACGKGHVFSKANTYIDPRGKRQCRRCRALAARRWYHLHSTRPRRLPLMERFWSKVEKTKGCWFWNGGLNDDGYGIFANSCGSQFAHRFVYEKLVGPVPKGKEIDHLCRVRRCVRPSHLEPVTHAENIARGDYSGNMNLAELKRAKTHCPQGHPYSGDNLIIDGTSGARRCHICTNEKARRYQNKRKRSGREMTDGEEAAR